ncbi:tetratricopeptide (TPR) repeat protein [Catenulispora sp. GP43]|uniref:tetratricopeptide repeat protein n=1 Tax=Catenulispora sp. GP43 TaxID=3156263 RepID=UPI00351173A7
MTTSTHPRSTAEPIRHVWVVGERRAARAAAASALAPRDLAVNCHRRLRGPFTGLGEVLRRLVPDAYSVAPALVESHRVAILCAAPELEPLIGSAPPTLTENAGPEERTRWYSPLRTRRFSHHLIEFLTAYAALRDDGALFLEFDTVEEADHTDAEFLAIALRRLDPGRVRLVVGTDADSTLIPELVTALDAYAVRVEGSGTDDSDGRESVVQARAQDQARAQARARAFVDSDCVSDVPGELEAYQDLEPATRARLHDERAEELERQDEFSLRLGAIPYHRLRGADPVRTAWPALVRAEMHCMDIGYYHAVLEYIEEMAGLLATAPPDHDLGGDHHVATRRGQILSLLGRPEDALAAYVRALSQTTGARQTMALHYNIGMLHTRFDRPERKDHTLAKAHLNTSIAMASQIADPGLRAFYTVFMSNGLALAELHLAQLASALELVDGGLAHLDRELQGHLHALHRSVLRHNRAQLLMALGRQDEALDDFDELVRLDPHYPEYYFDRGNARYQVGDVAGALADYEHTMTLSPPFPELFHNRGDLRAAGGDIDGAIADFSYVLELEPDWLESRIALSSLLLEIGAADAAAEVVAAGLALHPENPRLLCLLGETAIATGDTAAAHNALERALAADPALHQALAIRATLYFDEQRFDAAVADLDRALEIVGDDPDLLYNRGYVNEAAGQPADAVRDYTRALELPGADRDEILLRRELCLSEAS